MDMGELFPLNKELFKGIKEGVIMEIIFSNNSKFSSVKKNLTYTWVNDAIYKLNSISKLENLKIKVLYEENELLNEELELEKKANLYTKDREEEIRKKYKQGSILGKYFWGTEEIYIVVKEISKEIRDYSNKENISFEMLTQKVILHEIGHFLDYNGIKFQEFAEKKDKEEEYKKDRNYSFSYNNNKLSKIMKQLKYKNPYYNTYHTEYFAESFAHYMLGTLNNEDNFKKVSLFKKNREDKFRKITKELENEIENIIRI